MGSLVTARASRLAPTEFLWVVLIVLGAAAVRLWNIGNLPDGLHGDEAWTGLDARRIVDEGWIGPYVPSALGQPTGLLYFVAGLFLWLPDDITTIRFAIAVIGTLGIVFTYLVAREYEEPMFAACAAALLAGSLWHLHGSRVGMMFVSCSTFLMAGLWAQAVAMRRQTWLAAAAAGLVVGLGVYSYNAYPTALPLYAIPFLYAFSSVKTARERTRLCLRTAVFALAALVAASPLIAYAARDPAFFFRHHKQVSVFSSPQWLSDDWAARTALLAERSRFWFEGLFVQGRFDSGDGYGVAGFPLVDPITGCLAGVGLVLAVARWRRPLSMLMIAAGPLLSLGAVLTAGPGAFRRTISLAPFIAMLAALPLAGLYRAGAQWSERRRTKAPELAAVAVVAALVAMAVAHDLRAYFGPVAKDRQLRWVFARELRRASEFLADIPKGTRVYFFSERWSCHYETRRYLAPGIDCVDRSRRFGGIHSRSGLVDFSAPRGKPALLLLMGEHMRQLETLRKRHPEAKAEIGEIDGARIFAALYLPEGEARKVSTLLPADAADKPIIAVAALEPLDVRYDFEPPRVDQTWNGHPIELGGRRFARGLGMHAPTEVVYRVPSRTTKFAATVGLAPQVATSAVASVVFEVVDPKGRVLASSGILRAGDPPVRLVADLRGVRQVTLTAGDAGDGRDCDHANWGNPIFMRDPPARRDAQSVVREPAGESRSAATSRDKRPPAR
jgi:hypothetical protein